nr:diguanylate cyclase [uncultured Sphingomonas sp.]
MDQLAPARPTHSPAANAIGGGWLSPFVGAVPGSIRKPLLIQQAQRFHQSLPLLCLVVAANALAMMVAVLGDLPAWQQFGPPFVIVSTCLAGLLFWARRSPARTAEGAARQMRHAVVAAAVLGPIAGLWCVNAFDETDRYYCMVAPVFIGIASLVSATCLLNVPRAALVAIIGTITPIVIKMGLYDNLGVRAMAAMMVVVSVMQALIVTSKFNETVRTLSMQDELERLSHTDPLTGIGNRRAFMAALEDRIAEGRPSLLLMLDLDGFKDANDTHGHHVGDAILTGVAARLRLMMPGALSVARLGGDEFALLVDANELPLSAAALDQAIRDAIAAPFRLDTTAVAWIGTSVGAAHYPKDADKAAALMRVADKRLYADKADRKVDAGNRAVA